MTNNRRLTPQDLERLDNEIQRWSVEHRVESWLFCLAVAVLVVSLAWGIL